jgi:uncharacterized membrane protein (DUF2068 family)
MRRRSDALILLIGAFKLVKALALIALGVGAFSGMHRGAAHVVGQWVSPAHHTIHHAIARLEGIGDHQLHIFGILVLVYAVLFLVEGIGLLARRTWAEYMTSIVTASFIPLEIYELVEHRSPLKAVVIAVNVAIVVYLVLRLRADGHWPWHQTRVRRSDARATA